MNSRAVIVCAVVSLAGSASSQVTGIGPFVGDGFEGFENVAPPGTVNGPADIFGGDATVVDGFANNLIIALNLVSFVTNEEIFPYNGNLMGMTVTGFAEFEFATPIAEFGGYFGTADNLSGGSITFYDENDAVISSEAFELPLNDWGWHGWSSTTPISRISIAGNVNPGTPIVFDDLRLTYVPAPASAVLLGIAGCASARRRHS
ncbi:MAG: hypothetical protein Phyf2KO_00490 [Phycisphaerales bacterium]